MKKITTLLIALACVAITANATVTVNVRTSTGDAPYHYVWDGAGIMKSLRLSPALYFESRYLKRLYSHHCR